jgi:hypothetical protein
MYLKKSRRKEKGSGDEQTQTRSTLRIHSDRLDTKLGILREENKDLIFPCGVFFFRCQNRETFSPGVEKVKGQNEKTNKETERRTYEGFSPNFPLNSSRVILSSSLTTA